MPVPDVFWNMAREMSLVLNQSILIKLLAASLVISLVGSMESMLTAMVCDHLSGCRHNSIITGPHFFWIG